MGASPDANNEAPAPGTDQTGATPEVSSGAPSSEPDQTGDSAQAAQPDPVDAGAPNTQEEPPD